VSWWQRLFLISAALVFVAGVLNLGDGDPLGYVLIVGAGACVLSMFFDLRRNRPDTASGAADRADPSSG